MSRKPVVYHLEVQDVEAGDWLPIGDERGQPITFTGKQSKSRALTMAALVRRWPSWWGVRVRREAEVVGLWMKQGGVSA